MLIYMCFKCINVCLLTDKKFSVISGSSVIKSQASVCVCVREGGLPPVYKVRIALIT